MPLSRQSASGLRLRCACLSERRPRAARVGLPGALSIDLMMRSALAAPLPLSRAGCRLSITGRGGFESWCLQNIVPSYSPSVQTLDDSSVCTDRSPLKGRAERRC